MAVVSFPHAIQTDNMRVIELSQHPRFPLESLSEIMAKPELERQEL
jgi:hypothetical protein